MWKLLFFLFSLHSQWLFTGLWVSSADKQRCRGDKGCIFQLNEILPLLADASFVLLFRIQQRAHKVKDSLSALSAKPLLLVHNV